MSDWARHHFYEVISSASPTRWFDPTGPHCNRSERSGMPWLLLAEGIIVLAMFILIHWL